MRRPTAAARPSLGEAWNECGGFADAPQCVALVDESERTLRPSTGPLPSFSKKMFLLMYMVGENASCRFFLHFLLHWLPLAMLLRMLMVLLERFW